MSWKPNPTIRIDGINYTSNATGTISLNRGRKTVYERPQAGYASVELRDIGGMTPIQVGQKFEVLIDAGVYRWSRLETAWSLLPSTWSGVTDDPLFEQIPVFTGTVTDWSSSTIPTAATPITFYNVQAIGPIFRLNRRQVFSAGRPEETDGSRVRAAVQDGAALAWQEMPLNLTWSTVGTAVSWTNVDDETFDSALIDPGLFDIAALNPADAGYSALTAAQDAGFAGEGILFETATGFIGYADSNRRRVNEASGYLGLDAGELASDGLRVAQSLSDITNKATVEFDGGAVTFQDDFSIVQFGLYETAISTILANQTTAEDRAEEFVTRHAVPQNVLDGLRFNIGGMSNANRDRLLRIGPNDAIEIDNVPASVGFTTFRGFVEGLRLVIDDFNAELELTVSDRSLSIGSIRWGQVDGALQWTGVDAALKWEDARSF